MTNHKPRYAYKKSAAEEMFSCDSCGRSLGTCLEELYRHPLKGLSSGLSLSGVPLKILCIDCRGGRVVKVTVSEVTK